MQPTPESRHGMRPTPAKARIRIAAKSKTMGRNPFAQIHQKKTPSPISKKNVTVEPTPQARQNEIRENSVGAVVLELLTELEASKKLVEIYFICRWLGDRNT